MPSTYAGSLNLIFIVNIVILKINTLINFLLALLFSYFITYGGLYIKLTAETTIECLRL